MHSNHKMNNYHEISNDNFRYKTDMNNLIEMIIDENKSKYTNLYSVK